MSLELLLDLVFPRYCVGCDTEGVLLCDECLRRAYQKRTDAGCPLCGARSKFPNLCVSCKKDSGLVSVVSLGPFGGVIKEALHSLKFDDVREVSKPLADELADRCRELNAKPGVIVPVPLSAARARQRGYNQSALIAHRLSKNLGWPYLDALARTRNTQPQTDLNRRSRLKNLENAFTSKYSFKDNKKPIYILDDVITTGATLSSAVTALKNADARKVSGIAVAID